MRFRTKALISLILANLLLCVNAAPIAQALSGTQTDDELKITINLQEGQTLMPDGQLELQLNRALNKSENRLAILLGQTDITALFAAKEKSLVYNSKLLPLKVGQNQMVVYLISGLEEWKEIARFSFSVKDPNTAQTTEATPIKPENPPQEKAEENLKEKVGEEKKAAEAVDPAHKSNEKTGEKAEEKGANSSVEKGETTETKAATTEKAEEKAAQDSPPADSEKPAAEGPGGSTSAEPTPAETPKKIAGFEKLDFTPSITLSMKSQAAESHFPDETRPERPTFADFTIQGSFKNEVQRGPFNTQSQFDIAGSSFRKEALRFGQLGEAAPLVDLASYLMQFQIGKAKFFTGDRKSTRLNSSHTDISRM